MKKTVCALLAASLLLLGGCSKGEADASPTAASTPQPAPVSTPEPTAVPTPEPTPEPTPPPTKLGLTEDMGQEYQDSIVFYGDSNTNGMRLLEILPGGYSTKQIWTPISGTLTLSYWETSYIIYPETWTEIPVTECMQIKDPEYLIINLGMNGISFMDQEYFTSTYTAMVQALQAANPDTRIMLSSIFPVANSYPYQKDINNDKIAAANEWIYGIAEATGTRYIDTGEALRAEDGSLPENLHDGNGFHLTAEGYGLVLDYIRTHAYQ